MEVEETNDKPQAATPPPKPSKGWPDAVIALCHTDSSDMMPSPVALVAGGLAVMFMLLGLAAVLWVVSAYPKANPTIQIGAPLDNKRTP